MASAGSDLPTVLQDSYAKHQRRPIGPMPVDVADPQVQANRIQMMRMMKTSLGNFSGHNKYDGAGLRGGDGDSIAETTSSRMSKASRASSATLNHAPTAGLGGRSRGSKGSKKRLTGSQRAPEQILRGTLGQQSFRRASYAGAPNGKGLFNVEHELANHATLPPMNDVLSWGAPLASRPNSACVGPTSGRFSASALGKGKAP